MKKLILPFAFSLLTASAMAEGLKESTDPLSSVRTVNWSRQMGPSGDPGFSVAAYIAPDKKSELYDITLVAPIDYWQYRRCNSTAWRVDGKNAPYMKSVYKTIESGGVPIEILQANLSRSDLSRLAAAKKVVYQVCNSRGELTQSDIEGIRKVLAAVR